MSIILQCNMISVFICALIECFGWISHYIVSLCILLPNLGVYCEALFAWLRFLEVKWYRLWDWILHIGEFDDVLDAGFSEDLKSDVSEEIITEHTDLCVVSSSDCNGSIAKYECQKLLEVCNLTLQTPRSGNILIKELSFVINEGDHLLVCDFLW